MTGSRLSSDAERELSELRIRAYGPDPDIDSDPAALARLAELEVAHAASARPPIPDDGPPAAASETPPGTAPVPASDPAPSAEPAARLAVDGDGTDLSRPMSLRSGWLRATSTRPRRLGVVAGATVAALALVYAVAWVVTPHPDATLQATGNQPDGQLSTMLRFAGSLEIDVSSLRSYETYRGLEPWSGVDAWGNACLVIIERSTESLLGAECMPREATLLADVGAWPYWHDDFATGLPDASVIRFHLDGDTVEVFLHLASAVD
jgi:hypothetical protein